VNAYFEGCDVVCCFERLVQAFGHEDEARADNKEHCERADIDRHVDAPVEKTGDAHRAENRREEPGPPVEQKRRGNHRQDKRKEAIAPRVVRKKISDGQSGEHHQRRCAIANNYRLGAGQQPKKRFHSGRAKLLMTGEAT